MRTRTKSNRHSPLPPRGKGRLPRACKGRPGEAEERRASLARLLPLWPWELDDVSAEGRARMVARLASALRAERQRGIAGHWTYDLGRHASLLAAYRREAAVLAALARNGTE